MSVRPRESGDPGPQFRSKSLWIPAPRFRGDKFRGNEQSLRCSSFRGQKRVEDAPERADARASIFFAKSFFEDGMDCTATRARTSCALLGAASRVNPTCGVKPGNDGG